MSFFGKIIATGFVMSLMSFVPIIMVCIDVPRWTILVTWAIGCTGFLLVFFGALAAIWQ